MGEKSFYKGTQRYSFSYDKDNSDPNPASEWTFDDEEEVRVRYFYPNIKHGDVLFDIGASFGSYTLPALALGAKVYAFSPEHEYPLLKHNIIKNGHPEVGPPFNWYAFDVGMYSKRGYFKTDTMEYSKDKTRMLENRGSFTGWWIPVTTLDDFMDKHVDSDIPNYLKIDTEGAELEVLKGGLNTIERYKPKMLIELHLFKYRDRFRDTRRAFEAEIKDLLETRGYKTTTRPYTPDITHLYAWPAAKK